MAGNGGDTKSAARQAGYVRGYHRSTLAAAPAITTLRYTLVEPEKFFAAVHGASVVSDNGAHMASTIISPEPG